MTRIVIDPKVLFGKSHIAGMRIAVDLILEKLAAGETINDIPDSCPCLTLEDVRAALAFAAEYTRFAGVEPGR